MDWVRPLVVSLPVLAWAAAGAPAGAAVTVGPDVTGSSTTSSGCGASSGSGTFSTASLPGGFASSPIDGVVVRWRALIENTPGAPTFRIVRPTVMARVTGAGSSGGEPAFIGVGGPFPARLAIKSGDRIGIDLPCHPVSSPEVADGSTGTSDLFVPALLDGETPGRVPSSTSGGSTFVNADVEADADRDVFGDETQDACPGVFGSVNGCPVADLQLTMTASHTVESDLVTYTLVVRNNGPEEMPTLWSDTPPVDADVLTPPPGGRITGCSFSTLTTFRCAGSLLLNGGQESHTVVARLKKGSKTNSATVFSAVDPQLAAHGAGADPNPSNNTASATVTVSAPGVLFAKASPNTFRLGSLLPRFSRRPPIGTTISVKLSEPATATLAFSQPRTGRKVGRRCIAPTRSNRRKPRCIRKITAGSLTHKGHAGTNKVRFQGRLSRSRKLKPGRYTVTITAVDQAGNRSNAKTTSLTIVR